MNTSLQHFIATPEERKPAQNLTSKLAHAQLGYIGFMSTAEKG